MDVLEGKREREKSGCGSHFSAKSLLVWWLKLR